MAITKKLKDEADRTIAGISKYYEQCGDTLLDADEREHRIEKIESALEGCNGITEKEKIQKTAENLFGLTCSMERDFLALKRELAVSQKKTDASIEKLREDTSVELKKIGSSIEALDKKFGDIFKVPMLEQPRPQPQLTYENTQDGPKKDPVPWYAKLVGILDKHFGATMITLVILVVLLILSGNFDYIQQFLPNSNGK